MQKFNTNTSGLRFLDNDRGSIIVVALLMVMLLAIAVIGGNRSSTVEVKIAANKKVNDRDFYITEGLVSQGVKILENTLDNNRDDLLMDSPTKPVALVDKITLADGTEVLADEIKGYEDYDWNATAAGDQTWPDAAWQDFDPAATEFDYILISKGVASGEGLGVDGSRVYEYNVRGRVESDNRKSEISIGYRMRY